MSTPPVAGDVNLIFDALEEHWDSPAVQKMVAFLGTPTKSRTFRGMGPVRTYKRTPGEAVQYLLDKKDNLDAVFIHLTPEPDNKGSLAWEGDQTKLIHGLPTNAERSQVQGLLGAPEWSNGEADRWQIGTYHLHISYDTQGRLSRLTLMANAPD